MGANSHVEPSVSSGGPLGEGSDKGHDAISMPQCQVRTADPLEVRDGHGMIDLDEVSHEMLLGVIERYWVWSKS
jgi:hypothetical protein